MMLQTMVVYVGKRPFRLLGRYCSFFYTGTDAEPGSSDEEPVSSDDKLPDDKLPDEKLSEKNLTKKKLPDKKLPDKKLADKKLLDKKMPDKKCSDKKLADKKSAVLEERRDTVNYSACGTTSRQGAEFSGIEAKTTEAGTSSPQMLLENLV